MLLNECQTLVDLGLTSCQTRVYCLLLKWSYLSANMISRKLALNRGNVHHYLSELMGKGLVEKLISHPIMFKAIPLKEAVSILLQKRENETTKLRQEAKELLNNEEKYSINAISKFTESRISWIPKGQPFINKLHLAIENVKRTIDVIITEKTFREALTVRNQDYEKAMKRGVEIRWIIECRRLTDSTLKSVDAFSRYPHFEFKTVIKPAQVKLAVYDKKEAFIAINPNTDAFKSPIFWTNNPSFLEIICNYFENQWLAAFVQELLSS